MRRINKAVLSAGLAAATVVSGLSFGAAAATAVPDATTVATPPDQASTIDVAALTATAAFGASLGDQVTVSGTAEPGSTVQIARASTVRRSAPRTAPESHASPWHNSSAAAPRGRSSSTSTTAWVSRSPVPPTARSTPVAP